MIFQAIDIPHPRYITLILSTVNRSPSVIASIDKASSFFPSQPRSTLRRRSGKQRCTCTSRRFLPRLASAHVEKSLPIGAAPPPPAPSHLWDLDAGGGRDHETQDWDSRQRAGA